MDMLIKGPEGSDSAPGVERGALGKGPQPRGHRARHEILRDLAKHLRAALRRFDASSALPWSFPPPPAT